MSEPSETSWWARQSAGERATYIVGTMAGLLTIVGAVLQGVFPVLIERNADAVFVGAGATTVVLALSVLVLVLGNRRKKKFRALVAAARVAATEIPPVYDIFIAAPMTALNQVEYELQRQEILQVLEVLEQDLGFTAYYAGRRRARVDEFEAVDIGLAHDLQALKESIYFMLIYPKTLVSSVLVEAGMALVLKKPCVYFYGLGAKLPFVLRGAANSNAAEFPRVRQYEYESNADLVRQLSVNGAAMFKRPAHLSLLRGTAR